MRHEHKAEIHRSNREENRREEKDEKAERQRYREKWRRLNDKHKRQWTAWLLLRYTQLDWGLRPIGAGEPFWISPDISVESSDPLGNAVAEEENFVHARVFNLGKATAAPTKVDFYWADPSLGLGPANMNLIGTEWVEVKEHTAKDVRCNTPWVPVMLNNGHECLLVNTSNPILDPIAFPFQPRLDRHVGQRNIQVVKAKAGEQIEFALAVNNILPLPANTLILARTEHVTVLKNTIERIQYRQIINRLATYGALASNTPQAMVMQFREGTAEFRTAKQMAELASKQSRTDRGLEKSIIARSWYATSAPCINSNFLDHSCIIKQAGAYGQLGQLLSGLDKLSSTAHSFDASRNIVLQEARLAASEQRRLLLQMKIPADAKRDDFVVFHITQISEGLLLGGYTIVVEVASGPPSGTKGRQNETDR